MCDYYVVLGVECVTSVRGFRCGLCDFQAVLGVKCVTCMTFGLGCVLLFVDCVTTALVLLIM